jgi:phosphoribosylglycinamide formyltransferase-1
MTDPSPVTNHQSSITRLVVLISGKGSNLQAILDACANSTLNAQVVAVMSNKSDAFGLERAKHADVPAVVKAKPKDQERGVYDAELADLVASYQPDWVVLAGWMRVLSSAFLDRFPNRVVNLHPALPGTFPGTHAIERAYAAYRRGEIEHTGVMVHLVPDEGVDAGPVLAQEAVSISRDDTLDMLEAKIHTVEHRLLVETLQALNQPADFHIDRLDHLVLTVRDVEATCSFYERVLGMQAITFDQARTALVFGQQKINLHAAGREFEPKADRPTPGSADLCFVTSTPLPRVIAHLAASLVAIVEGPVSRTGAIGTLRSVYIRDPDHNLIEISNYI